MPPSSMGPPQPGMPPMGGPPQPGMGPPSSMGGMPPRPGMGGPPQPGMMPPNSMGYPPQPGMGGMPPQPGMGGMPPQPGMGGPGMGGPGMGGPGYPGGMQQGQQRQGLNPDNMPNPIQVMKEDRTSHGGAEFCTNEKGKVPPLVTTPFLTRDQGNAGPRLIRSTMYSVPDSPDMKKQTAVPLGLVMSPMAPPLAGGPW